MTKPMNSPSHESVCIVGMGCVLPGAVGVDDFWRNLLSGHNAIVDVPAERWNRKAHYDADPLAPDKTYACCGGFIDNALLREIAGHLDVDWDSHHRLAIMAMEACRQALTGLSAEDLRGCKTDLILGCMATDESMNLRLLHRDSRGTLGLLKTAQPAGWDQATATIEGYFTERLRTAIPERHTVLTTSVLQALKLRHGLNGEGALIDAACASSLAAIDVAATRLSERRCDIAVTGGFEGDLR